MINMKYSFFSLIFLVCYDFNGLFSQTECKQQMLKFEQTAIANGAEKYVDFQQGDDNKVREIKNMIIDSMSSFEFDDCFPLNIWLMFVIEPNDIISDVFLCSEMIFCEQNEDVRKYEESITEVMRSAPLKAGKIENQKVKTLFPMKIHLSPN